MGAVLGLAWACVRAVGSFLGRRPQVVVIVGGYASFPAGVAAVLARVPLVSVNTDAVPGAVNHLLGRFAAANAVAFAGTDLPVGARHRHARVARARHLGSDPRGPGPQPGRARATDRAPHGGVRRRLTRRVACQPGGGGPGCLVGRVRGPCALPGHRPARRRAFAPDSPDSPGDQQVRLDSQDAGPGLFYRVVPFEDRMPDLYNAADVCVLRSGAMTVAEVMAAGVPAILVPLPGAPRDHQTRNAEALVGLGAAVLVPDRECDGARLARELDALLSDPDRLRSMSEAARANGHPDAAARVAELVDTHAR